MAEKLQYYQLHLRKRPTKIKAPSLWLSMGLLLMMIGSHSPHKTHNNLPPPSVVRVVAASIPRTISIHKQNPDLQQKAHATSRSSSRLNGLISLFQQHPGFLVSAVIRIGVAMTLELVLDGLLKTVVTPALIATGIGAVAAPLTFLLEYALQPIIHSLAFIIFDDRFLMAALEATGIQHCLEQESGKAWHKMTLIEGIFTRYVIKSLAAWCLGWAGLCTAIPVAGHMLTAGLTGWIVAWDYVYVPLSGMGHVGPWQQLQTVWTHWGDYQWFGVWAVLLEELPFLGPTCHVWNVYNAAFFLERVYLLQTTNSQDDDDATVSTVATDEDSFREL